MAHGTNLLRKIGWTLLTGFIGFSVSGLFDDLLKVSLADQLLVTIVIGGVTLLVQYLADLEHRISRSDEHHRQAMESLRDLIQRGFDGVDEATELKAAIEQSAVSPDLLKQVVRRSAHISSTSLPLVQSLAESETRRLAYTLQALSDGHEVFYDGEDREFILALTVGTRSSLLATSWATVNEDEDEVGFEAGFWLSDLGARYLDLQRAAVRRGVVIQRIFIAESPALMTSPELRRILAMQRNAGIQVRLLDGREVAQDGSLSDFVIFDNQICYDTTPVTRQAPVAPWRLTTRMLLDAEITRHRLELFRELWESALPVRQPHVGEDGPPMVARTESLGPA